jgi:hypothetical protein
MWCIPRLDGEYVARMENVLDLYAEAPILAGRWSTSTRAPVQLIGRLRQPMPAEPGQFERYDYEYRRNGTVNLFVCVDVRLAARRASASLRGRIHRPSLGFTARTADRHPQRRKGPPRARRPPCIGNYTAIPARRRAAACCTRKASVNTSNPGMLSFVSIKPRW